MPIAAWSHALTIGSGWQQVLEVVEHEKKALVGQERRDSVLERLHGALPNPKGGCDGRQDQRRIRQRRQIHKPDPVRKGIERFACDSQRKACLARSTRTGKSHEPCAFAFEEPADLLDLLLATDKRRELDRQVVPAPIKAVQRRELMREVRVQELIDPLRLQQIPQPVFPQVPQLAPLGQRPPGQLLDGLGEENLAPMTRRHQPREPVQRGRQVVPARIRRGVSRVQGHAHSQRSGRIAPVLGQQRALAGDGGP